MKHLTRKQINHLIREERKDSLMYKRLGIQGIASEEKRHMDFFKMLKARRKRK
jgi:hypothetical protein